MPTRQPHGRGSSRRLSERNLLEVAIATTASRLGIAADTVRKLLAALRIWELGMAAEGLELPRSIEVDEGPTVRLILDDNAATHVAMGWGNETTTVKGPVRPADARNAAKAPPRAARAGTASGFGWPEGSRACRLEINVTAIAQRLRTTRDAVAPKCPETARPATATRP